MTLGQAEAPLSHLLGAGINSPYAPGVRYQVVRRLGEGGTAAAFLATRVAPDGQSPVVLKIILPQVANDSDERALTFIKKEAVALGRLNERVPPSPYVVRLIDTGSMPMPHGGNTLELPWLALEYIHGGIEGTTLSERVVASVRATGSAFDPARAAHCIRSLAQGLGEIHAEGVVHRDLTPGNVLCCGAGDSELFKISDFGFARPVGLTATFGEAAVVGTPGYVALEQLNSKQDVSAAADIFSLAAICFFILTGEHYFPPNVAAAIEALQRPERRSVADAPALTPELRDRPAACRAIDMALASATSNDPSHRPPSAEQFADSLLPWIWAEKSPMRPSRRWVTAMHKLRGPSFSSMTTWTTAHPTGDDRLVLSAAWNATGHALAATTHGLAFWSGTAWLPVSGPLPMSTVQFVRRLSPTSWIVCGDGGRFFEFSREGCNEMLRAHDPNLTLSDATIDFDDIAVAVGKRPDSCPLLLAHVGRHWLKPLPVPQATTLTGVARIDEEHWLVVGRHEEGRAYAARYRPLDWTLTELTTPPARALLACAGRPERGEAVAVGAEGVVLEVGASSVRGMSLSGTPDLGAVGIDQLGRKWAASAGRIWVSRGDGQWSLARHEPNWHVPFVSVMAEVGVVAAMTVDGGVLECSSDTLIGDTVMGRPSYA